MSVSKRLSGCWVKKFDDGNSIVRSAKLTRADIKKVLDEVPGDAYEFVLVKNDKLASKDSPTHALLVKPAFTPEAKTTDDF